MVSILFQYVYAISECLEQPEWKSVPGLSSMENVVCRTSNRVFVGLSLCERSHDLPCIWFLLELFKAVTLTGYILTFSIPLKS